MVWHNSYTDVDVLNLLGSFLYIWVHSNGPVPATKNICNSEELIELHESSQERGHRGSYIRLRSDHVRIRVAIGIFRHQEDFIQNNGKKTWAARCWDVQPRNPAYSAPRHLTGGRKLADLLPKPQPRCQPFYHNLELHPFGSFILPDVGHPHT